MICIFVTISIFSTVDIEWLESSQVVHFREIKNHLYALISRQYGHGTEYVCQ